MNQALNWCRSWYVFYKCLLEKRRREEARRIALGAYLRLCLDGFFPNKWELYQFHQNRREKYVTDQQMLRTAYIDGEQTVLVNDKVIFELAMGKFVRIPHNFAFFNNGHLISLDPEINNLSDLKGLLERDKNLIAKPTYGLGGKGIIHLQHDENGFTSNGRKKNWHQIVTLLLNSGDVIVCEYVRQGVFANRLYPQTVNTIRMLSMRDPESGRAFIAAAAFRIGSLRSLPVDNISAGGIVCGIDLVEGRLGRAATGFFDQGPFRWIDKHPDTGLRLQGLTIPMWKSVCKQIEALADKFPRMPYVAWDVALGNDDIVVIEGNAWSDVSIFQINRPLLMDDRIVAFLKHHRII